MNIVRRARSECMCVRLLCSLFRRDHEQVVEKIMPVDNLRSGLIVQLVCFALLRGGITYIFIVDDFKSHQPSGLRWFSGGV